MDRRAAASGLQRDASTADQRLGDSRLQTVNQLGRLAARVIRVRKVVLDGRSGACDPALAPK